ncbi:MAG TPA: guanylate kinase [Gemmatimonadaceae bacterium]
MRAFPVILSSPSGGGKTAIAKGLLERRTDVGYSVSCTTRQPRAGEVDGREYYFYSVGEFLAARDRGEFAEWAEVHGRLYGTRRREMENVMASGRHVLMDIDVQGAAQLREAYPDAVSVFVLPPSASELVRRLMARKSESAESLKTRLTSALAELRAVKWYDYVVVNDDLGRAIGVVSGIIDAESAKRHRVQDLEAQMSALIQQLEHEIDKRS